MSRPPSPVSEPLSMRLVLIATAFAFLFMLIIMPVLTVFMQALSKGLETYTKAIVEENAMAAIKLTCLVAAIAVPLNLIFGIAASWAIAKFEFFGKRLLITLIDLPFSVSPVISGLIYVLLFGAGSLFGVWPVLVVKFAGLITIIALLAISLKLAADYILDDTSSLVWRVIVGLIAASVILRIAVGLYTSGTELAHWLVDTETQIIFAVPGLVLATIFVTFPFVARELIPLMEEQGTDEEQAAILLGANGWQTFFRVTLPNIKWGLLYGILLCNARAMGEFGAVSVVSGHIRGQTNTIPLHVEILYNEYNFVAAFAVASILTILALITLLIKTLIELKFSRKVKHGH